MIVKKKKLCICKHLKHHQILLNDLLSNIYPFHFVDVAVTVTMKVCNFIPLKREGL